jgi:hypothetical protein
MPSAPLAPSPGDLDAMILWRDEDLTRILGLDPDAQTPPAAPPNDAPNPTAAG